MNILKAEQELRSQIGLYRKAGETVGFVPTMGFLHEGHLSLVRLAREAAKRVVVSIFVNPTQFNDPKDFEKYPIDLERDFEMLRGEDVDAVYVPTRESIYGLPPADQPGGFQSWVALSQLPLEHEGEFRPGHFKGVSTVVAILFNLVRPDAAVFGEKDFQQLRIIEQMVDDLKYDIKIIRGPLVREGDGLAMSSRNVRLDPAQRQAALLLSKGLFRARDLWEKGETNCASLLNAIKELLGKSDLIRTEYVRIVDEIKLKEQRTTEGPSRAILAAFVGPVRLIDNIALS